MVRGKALLSTTVFMRRNNTAHLEAIGLDFMGGRLTVRERWDYRRNKKLKVSNQSKNEEIESRKGRVQVKKLIWQ